MDQIWWLFEGNIVLIIKGIWRLFGREYNAYHKWNIVLIMNNKHTEDTILRQKQTSSTSSESMV